MKAVLDAGAFVAVEQRDRRVGAMLRVLQQRKVPLLTSAAVVAQVWRDGRKQALLAQILSGIAVAPLGAGIDRKTGELLAVSHGHDVIDAHLALCIDEADHVLTSDPVDLRRLLDARRVAATVVRC